MKNYIRSRVSKPLKSHLITIDTPVIFSINEQILTYLHNFN